MQDTQDDGDDDDAFLEEAIKLAAAEKKALDKLNCRHGHIHLPSHDRAVGFLRTFLVEFRASCHRGDHPMVAMAGGHKEATEKFTGVWNDPVKQKWILSPGATFYRVGRQIFSMENMIMHG